jgi:hypothetical protein
MQFSTTMKNAVASMTSVESVVDYCTRALYNRYPSTFITTGIDAEDAPIRSQVVEHWAGSRIIGNNIAQEQIYVSFLTTVDVGHKQSATPWTLVAPLGAASDTPNGIYA